MIPLRVLEWEAVFLLEILKYSTAYLISMNPRLRWRRTPLIGCAALFPFILTAILRLHITIEEAYIILMGAAVICMYLMIDEIWKTRIWHMLILILCVTSVDSIIDHLFEQIDFLLAQTEEIQILVWSSFSFLVLRIALQIKRQYVRKTKGAGELHGTSVVQIIIVCSNICFCICASFMYYMSHEAGLSHSPVYLLVSSLGFLGVALLGMQVWYILSVNFEIRTLIRSERRLNDIERKYYVLLLEREEETRKYRHDMKNHFICIDALLRNGSEEDLKKYLRNIEADFQDISPALYSTGNTIIDAISNHHLGPIRDFADVRVSGQITRETAADGSSLCTIYANLLQNAVEEILRLRDRKASLTQSSSDGSVGGTENGRPKLRVTFRTGSSFLKIQIQNSIRKRAGIGVAIGSTSKADKKNHGIGLRNVRRTVDRENGTFHMAVRDGMFCAEVVLPLRSEESAIPSDDMKTKIAAGTADRL